MHICVMEIGCVMGCKDVIIIGGIAGSMMVSSVDDVAKVVAVVFSRDVCLSRMIELMLIRCGMVTPLLVMGRLIQVVRVKSVLLIVMWRLFKMMSSCLIVVVWSCCFLVVMRGSFEGVVRNVLLVMVRVI